MCPLIQNQSRIQVNQTKSDQIKPISAKLPAIGCSAFDVHCSMFPISLLKPVFPPCHGIVNMIRFFLSMFSACLNRWWLGVWLLVVTAGAHAGSALDFRREVLANTHYSVSRQFIAHDAPYLAG